MKVLAASLTQWFLAACTTKQECEACIKTVG